MSTDRSFGRYRVTATLGAGAMGEVFAAVDEVLGREVAVKTLRRTHGGLAARLLDDRFRQEARAIAALHHPGVVQVFDLDLTADPPFLVMERVQGPSLKERLTHGPLPAGELRALGIQIARALAAAHAANIIHRDVKPANILAAGPGQWKLADFGVAHVPDSSITMTGQFVGSPAYAPPEALIRGVSGAAGDVYGLAATMYEAAAGRWPRGEASEGTMGALLAPLPPLGSLVPSLPPEVLVIIDRSVAVEPEQRPTANELADALAGMASVARAVSAVAPPVRAARPVRWQPWLICGAIVAALVITAAELSGGGPAAAVVAPDDHAAPTPAPPRGKQAKDLNKIRDDLAKGHTEPARHKLDEYEERYGASDDTRALRAQLGALDADGPGHDDPDHDHDDDDRPEPPPPADPHGPPGPPGPPHHGHHHR